MRANAVLALLPILLPAPVLGAPETYRCRLSDESHATTVFFTLDPAQFAAPVSPDDPPRRQVARVTIDGHEVAAGAILTHDGARGFWLPDEGLMLVRNPDGRATLSRGAARLTGHCEPAG